MTLPTEPTEPPAAPSPVAAPPPVGPHSARQGRFRDLPVWIQAVTAVLGVVLAGIGVTLTAVQIQNGRETPAPQPTPIVITPKAFIQQLTIEADEVRAHGVFTNVDLASEVILFVGWPDGAAPKSYLPVEATVVAPSVSPGARVDGGWEALRPMTEKGSFTWQAWVVTAGTGAADQYDDIKKNGPDSALVLATSESVHTGP